MRSWTSGGIDHIPVHHTNEMAQSEAANGKPLANYWLHGDFLLTGSDKMAKSDDNFLTLGLLKSKNIAPLAYRYFLLQTHYRKQLTFSWEALQAAQNGLKHLYELARALPKKLPATSQAETVEEFSSALANDLDTPAALALLWTALKEKRVSLKTLLRFDEVLGLRIAENIDIPVATVPAKVLKLQAERDAARVEKNWARSDELRKKIEELGYKIEDGPGGSRLTKI